MPGYFITGTGTEIGKTLVTAALCVQYRNLGGDVLALKPIATGFTPQTCEDSDMATLAQAMGRELTPELIDEISYQRFTEPLSPDMAAHRAGVEIDFDSLCNFCKTALADPRRLTLIEGIGGAFVPFTPSKTVADLIAALELPSLVVAGSYLGALSHTIATIEAMRARNIAVRAVIVNESPASPASLSETITTLRHHLTGITVTGIPRLTNSVEPWRAAPDLTFLLNGTP